MICVSGKDTSGAEYFIGIYRDTYEMSQKAEEDFDPFDLFKDSNDEIGPLDEVTHFVLELNFAKGVKDIEPYSGSVCDATCGRLFLEVCQKFAVSDAQTVKWPKAT